MRLIATAVLVSLVACGEKKPPEAAADEAATAEAPEPVAEPEPEPEPEPESTGQLDLPF